MMALFVWTINSGSIPREFNPQSRAPSKTPVIRTVTPKTPPPPPGIHSYNKGKFEDGRTFQSSRTNLNLT